MDPSLCSSAAGSFPLVCWEPEELKTLFLHNQTQKKEEREDSLFIQFYFWQKQREGVTFNT